MLILTCLLTLSITVLVQQHLAKKDISLRYLLKTVTFTMQNSFSYAFLNALQILTGLHRIARIES
jgi:hypothetical protein